MIQFIVKRYHCKLLNDIAFYILGREIFTDAIHTPTNIALQENEVYVRSEADNFQDEWPVHTHNGYDTDYLFKEMQFFNR